MLLLAEACGKKKHRVAWSAAKPMAMKDRYTMAGGYEEEYRRNCESIFPPGGHPTSWEFALGGTVVKLKDIYAAIFGEKWNNERQEKAKPANNHRHCYPAFLFKHNHIAFWIMGSLSPWV